MTHNQSDPTHSQPEPEAGVQVSLAEGIRCFFDIGEHTVSVWGSAWNGREEVRVDGELVASQRNLTRLQNRLEFQLDGDDYHVIFATESILRGRYSVALYRGDQLLESDSGSFRLLSGLWRWGWKGVIALYLAIFAIGFLAGAMGVFLQGGQ